MKILGIETSCDETGLAIYDSATHQVVDVVYSQIPLHQHYGGIVPELASRDHIKKITPLLHELLQKTKLTLNDIDAIGVTVGPGLIGALMVGALFGRSLAFSLNIPWIPVHHMEAHLLAVMLETETPAFPFLTLLVSGGHTLLVKTESVRSYEVLGESVDDAVGEAFDKTAKLMGFPYPGGAALAQLAEYGDATQYHFPRPMVNQPNLNFSFSGLKTHALTTWQRSDQSDQTKANIAAAFQEAVVDTLVNKCKKALQQCGLKTLVVAGGVAANKTLRHQLTELLTELEGAVYFPQLAYCTDNGAMVAYAAYALFHSNSAYYQKLQSDLSVKIYPRWSLSSLGFD